MLKACPTCARIGCTKHQTKPGQRTGRPRGSTRAYRKARARVLRRSSTCHYCGKPATETDHVTPVAKGGTDHEANLVACCSECNQAKSDSVPCRLT
jgi:5-methylcytosine-specific restriction endonuclease McrA